MRPPLGRTAGFPAGPRQYSVREAKLKAKDLEGDFMRL
jgi:hypothetical protein